MNPDDIPDVFFVLFRPSRVFYIGQQLFLTPTQFFMIHSKIVTFISLSHMLSHQKGVRYFVIFIPLSAHAQLPKKQITINVYILLVPHLKLDQWLSILNHFVITFVFSRICEDSTSILTVFLHKPIWCMFLKVRNNVTMTICTFELIKNIK